jgi:glutamate formiminotransferase / formiminotetrahydrofolate cyclodeaminase
MNDTQGKQLIECIPNISEGRDNTKIEAIAAAIKSVDKVKLLHVDPGNSANRTVFTFAGTPEDVTEAAYQLIKKTSELIDMQIQKGVHPRFGATDVCPLVPVANISVKQTVSYAHTLAKRVGSELSIPVYCYEHAALKKDRVHLDQCRKGGYEALKDKITKPEWKPDFGPAHFNIRSGATAIGVRNFLIAYNINLNTKDVNKAKEIAAKIRLKRQAGIPPFEKVKAIGWFIEEFDMAQVSMNITDYKTSPLGPVYNMVKTLANEAGTTVNGSEIVGMSPEQCFIDAGRYFINDNQKTTKQLIYAAIKNLGLDKLYTFNPDEKILEIKQNVINNR